MSKHTADLLEALKEAISFQNEDTECLTDDDDPCPDDRCKHYGCMVMHVNRWRAIVRKAEKSERETAPL